jgi:hypothetical protein
MYVYIFLYNYKPRPQGQRAQTTCTSQASYCYKLPPNVSLQEGAMQLSDAWAWVAWVAWAQALLPSFSINQE